MIDIVQLPPVLYGYLGMSFFVYFVNSLQQGSATSRFKGSFWNSPCKMCYYLRHPCLLSIMTFSVLIRVIVYCCSFHTFATGRKRQPRVSVIFLTTIPYRTITTTIQTNSPLTNASTILKATLGSRDWVLFMCPPLLPSNSSLRQTLCDYHWLSWLPLIIQLPAWPLETHSGMAGNLAEGALSPVPWLQLPLLWHWSRF